MSQSKPDIGVKLGHCPECMEWLSEWPNKVRTKLRITIIVGQVNVLSAPVDIRLNKLEYNAVGESIQMTEHEHESRASRTFGIERE